MSTGIIASDVDGSSAPDLTSDDSSPDEQLQPLLIRAPRVSDAAGIERLVRRLPFLDTNSAYAYLLLCTDFASTSAVAVDEDQIAGFVLGYRPPPRPDAYFVWQVAVSELHRGRGLAGELLAHVVSRAGRLGVRFLEATVTPSNQASWSLFRGFARRADAPLRETSTFPSELFPDEGHEEEVRIRIGPLDPGSVGRDPEENVP